MRPAFAIVRLFRWHPQNLAHKPKVEVQQKGSVKEQEVFTATLGIAGKFQIADTKIGVAPNGDYKSRISRFCFGAKRFNRRAVAFHDEPVCRGDAAKRAIFRDFQNEGVIKAAGALHHGASAGATAVNGNSFCFTSCNVDL